MVVAWVNLKFEGLRLLLLAQRRKKPSNRRKLNMKNIIWIGDLGKILQDPQGRSRNMKRLATIVSILGVFLAASYAAYGGDEFVFVANLSGEQEVLGEPPFLAPPARHRDRYRWAI
jgi:hypothetical protein